MFKSNWVLDPGKFLTHEEARKLLETVKGRAREATNGSVSTIANPSGSIQLTGLTPTYAYIFIPSL